VRPGGHQKPPGEIWSSSTHAFDYESGYLRRILAFIGITDVEIVLTGGTASVAFGSTTLEELADQFRPAVLAAAR